jgi:glutamyl-tRNA synthetase
MTKEVRVRFAPSPTGGLHLGGVRTVLYNYLFAKKNNGKFILRIEDTDQTRFVEGAEQYIYDCLNWCGLTPDESPKHGGTFGPYKQSERKSAGIYQQYADKLVADGNAYMAFDTPEELEKMRQDFKTDINPSPQYDATIRMHMKNSISLSKDQVDQLLTANTPYVIRIKMPTDETISFTDMIRGEVKFDSNLIDDKVLLKKDGMPTYHLAVVVDDYLMQISHAFRGEEWLPSAPVHIQVWKNLFGLDKMPEWAHLPLILGPNGKLSKRDGAKYGFPVFAMDWEDKGELVKGFKEMGFLPEAFINLLAVLGWNNGTEQEIFTKDELIENFSIEKVHHGGAKFDYEKAKWFNHEWLKKLNNSQIVEKLKSFADDKYANLEVSYLSTIVGLVKERCHLLSDFWLQLSYFFEAPTQLDVDSVKPKWNEEKSNFFVALIEKINSLTVWNVSVIESSFKDLATEKNIKMGELQLPFRIMLVGGKFGPTVFDIANLIGLEETCKRIAFGVQKINE